MKQQLFVAIALSLGLSSAQAGTLADIYKQALESDPQLKIARATSKADAEIQNQRKSGLLPDISLDADLGYRDSDPNSTTDGNSNGYTVSLTQPVFRAENWFNFQQGKILSDKAALEFSQAQQTLIRRTISDYLDVLQAQNVYETTVAEEAAFKRRLEQVEAQFEVGLIAITDVEEAKAGYDLARVNRIIAKGDLDNSFENIHRLTGEYMHQVANLKDDYLIYKLQPAEYHPWVTKALDNNLALQIAQYDVDAAMESRRATESRHYPTVDLVASYGRNDTNATGGDVDSGFIGLNFNLPLYQGGRTSSEIRESFQRWDASIETLEDTRRQVVQETRSLYRDIETDVDSVAARKQTITSTETALEATEAGYSVGTRNIVDVLEAERRVYEAIRDYQTARYTFIRNQISFKESLGILSPDDLYSLDSWLQSPK
ncbi:MAG: TolC family outer membrane protein [Motiliproteus sp.]|nr:TolC family outer membrane protein [Motiliproteus sp.]